VGGYAANLPERARRSYRSRDAAEWPDRTYDGRVINRLRQNPLVVALGVLFGVFGALTVIHDLATDTAPWLVSLTAPIVDALARVPVEAWVALGVAVIVYWRLIIRRYRTLAEVRRREAEAFLSLMIEQADQAPSAPLTRIVIEHATPLLQAQRGEVKLSRIEAARHEGALIAVAEETGRQVQGILREVANAIDTPPQGVSDEDANGRVRNS
jgi:hypothetical protein